MREMHLTSDIEANAADFLAISAANPVRQWASVSVSKVTRLGSVSSKGLEKQSTKHNTTRRYCSLSPPLCCSLHRGV
ncbi:hypothetical protein P8452_08504 [Trifolium repens]|nr:hypothetical protein P8452_08504 [Trifolium repens]